MAIEIIEETTEGLPDYAQIPIAFTVVSRLRVQLIASGLGGIALVEEAVAPYIKDYDAVPGEGPLHWGERWDTSNWGVLSAFDGPRRLGGATMAWKTPGLDDLETRGNLAVLWDLRVHPEYRGKGVGHRLFTSAMEWARARHCRRLKVETQNINVPACRFYARQGCELGAIHRFAYGPTLNEVQLHWYRDI